MGIENEKKKKKKKKRKKNTTSIPFNFLNRATTGSGKNGKQ